MQQEQEQTTSPAIPTPEHRQKAVAKLYVDIFESLLNIVSNDLPPADSLRVLEFLKDRLTQYKGALTQKAFHRWAIRTVKVEAKRYQFTAQVLTEHGTAIRAAIRSALRSGILDCAITDEDLFQEVSSLIFQMAPQLAKSGTAMISSRLWALAQMHVAYHMKKRVNRNRIVKRYGGVGLQSKPCLLWNWLRTVRT